MKNIEERVAELKAARDALKGGSLIGAQGKSRPPGKLSAQERALELVDPGTFQELFPLAEHQCRDFGMDKVKIPHDGVITGQGKIDGRQVFIFSQDSTVAGGSVGVVHAQKICQIMDLAVSTGVAIIGLLDSVGARMQEGIGAYNYGSIFARTARASGSVPQISAIMGTCVGGAVYAPAMTDFIIMVENTSTMFITGPPVIKAVMGEEISKEELGGPKVHFQKTGVVDFLVKNDSDCLKLIRQILSYLPANSRENPPVFKKNEPLPDRDETLNSIVPTDSKKIYDMKQIIKKVLDPDSFLEVKAGFARNMIVGFGRLEGKSVGIVANQPSVLGGSIDINAADKSARFIRVCDSFNIPLITFVDTPAYLPGINQEHGGIIRHGSKMLFAYGEATVPKITVVIRKSYGGGISAMCGIKSMGPDQLYAWPTAEIAIMGAEIAVNSLFRKQFEEAKDPEVLRKKMIEEYQEEYYNPLRLAQRWILDDVIEPSETRPRLIQALDMLSQKIEQRPLKKHGNIPL
ncbi:MAG: acyl-CoA carboxylase subunit beta [Proteobacteria bacterium]|nr:acyl-CoA carboxylase subunit beta [Pseudomonadota bacterium]